MINQPCFPIFIQFGQHTTALRLRFWETDGRTSHRFTGSNRNPPLFRIINRTIEVINNSIMLYHITFVSKQFIIVFRGNNKVFSSPVGPVHQVIAGSKSIESLVSP